MIQNNDEPSGIVPEKTFSRAEIIRNRWLLVGVFIIFLAPVSVAYFGYFGGWFSDFGQSNRGELINPVMPVSQFQLIRNQNVLTADNTEHKWYLVYIQQAATCDETCALRLYTQHSVWVSLSKHQERVRLAYLSGGTLPAKESVEKWQATFSGNGIQGEAGLQLESGYYYLIDPMGNIMMRYRVPSTQDEAQQRYKDMKKDFDKLMKFSHIG